MTIHQISGEHWNEMLTHFSLGKSKSFPGGHAVGVSNGHRYIFVNGTTLTHEDILQITAEKTQNLTHSDTLTKAKNAFDLYVKFLKDIRTYIVLPALKTYSARFSDWANKNYKLAYVLSLLTLGLLFKVWNDGNAILGQSSAQEKGLLEAQTLAKEIEDKLNAMRKPLDEFPDVILGIIFNLLPTEDRITLMQWDKARTIMQGTQASKIKMIESYQSAYINALENLQNDVYTPIIEQIRKLKEDLINKDVPHGYIVNGKLDTKVSFLQLDQDEAEEYVARSILHLMDRPFIGLEAQNPPEDFKRMMKNKTILELCLRFTWNGIQWTSDELKNDKELILKTVQRFPRCYNFCSPALKNDADVVLATVKRDGTSLEAVPDAFKDNEGIVREAVTNSGFAFRFASDRLKANPELALIAIKKDDGIFRYIPEHLQQNKEILIELIKKGHRTLYYSAPNHLRNDPDVLAAYNSV